jgi:chromosome segregation ATPase
MNVTYHAEKMDKLEKEYKDRLKKASMRSRSSKSSDFGGGTEDTTTEGGEGGGDTAGGGTDRYDQEIIELRIKEVNDKWKLEVERLENEKDQLESRVRELEDQLEQNRLAGDRSGEEMAEARRKSQIEIDRLKNEILQMHDRHLAELEDERESYQKNLDAVRHTEEELQGKIEKLEKQLADALNMQGELERERREHDDRVDALTIQNQKLRDDLEDARTEGDKEVQKWKTDAYSARSELKSLETALAGLRSQLAASTDRNDSLNKTVNDHVSKIRDLTSQIRKLEEDLSEARSNLMARETELNTAQDRLRNLEEQHAQLQIEQIRIRNEGDEAKRENETLKADNGNLESEVEKLRRRLAELDSTVKEQKNSLDHNRSEVGK